MRNIIQKLSYLFVAVVFLFLLAHPVWAQNFAGIYQAEAEESDVAIDKAKSDLLLKEPLKETGNLSSSMSALPIEMGLADPSKYTLGSTDVIEIAVLRHPEFSGEFAINNEGNIQYSYVGDVKVAGYTKEEVKQILKNILSEYIINPDVVVTITGYNSKIVYVIGEVARPGRIFMQGDAITIREALVQAGLPLLSASTRKCRLITPSDDGKPELKYVNVFSLLYEGDLRENLVMNPGDTLYVPATVMSKAMRVISPVTQPVSAVGGAAGTAYGF